MATTDTANSVPVKHIARIVLVTAIILSIPLVAMRFTSEVQWTVLDFAVIGTLLFGAGMVYELIALRLRTTNQRLVAAMVILCGVLWLWAELAVGVFTNWGS